MDKKKIAVLLVGGMTALTLGGCSVPVLGPESSSKTLDQTNPITLKTVSMFGDGDPSGTTYKAICQEFMKDHPNVTIEDNSQTSDEEWKTMVNADFSVGNEPDVIQFFTDATADSLVATRKLVSIQEIRREYPEYAQDTYEEALDAAANTDGIRRAVPTTSYWEGLYCNADLFQQYGLELPTNWESLEKAIKVFDKNGIVPIACSLNSVPHYWMEYLMLYSAGVEEYTSKPETAPEGWIKGLSLFKTLRDMDAFPQNTDTVDDAYTSQLFRDKKAAMQLDGSWYAAKIVDTANTVVIPFPGVPEQEAETGTIVGGISSGFYITRKAWDDPTKRDIAVQFVMAHTCKSGVQRYWEITGGVTQAVTEVEPVSLDSPFAESVNEYTKSAVDTVAPTDSRIGNAYKTLVPDIVKISTGAMKAEDAINEALTSK